jgi:hypothetical protein
MNEFLLIFRRDADFDVQLTSDNSPEILKQWQDWMGGMAAQNKLADRGNRLDDAGKVIKAGNIVTNGAYVEVKELIAGYTMIRASSLDEATEIGKGCPILKVGGNVEVRPIVQM